MMRVCVIGIMVSMCLMKCSLQFDPSDNYLINCGSSTNVSVGNRTFMPHSTFNSSTTLVLLSAPHGIMAKATSTSNSENLYKTALIFPDNSNYTFSITKPGRHWIRLHFFPFHFNNYNLSNAKFSISLQHYTLLKDFQVTTTTTAAAAIINPVIKEYYLHITSDKLVIAFKPSHHSFAFLNALELVSGPDHLFPHTLATIHNPASTLNLLHHAFQTTFRVNMGNTPVNPLNDTLFRKWLPDGPFLKSTNLVSFLSKPHPVHYSTQPGPTPDIAPPSVYGTATYLKSELDPNLNVNVTWYFNVDPGFRYFVRFHFCDIVSKSAAQMVFNVYVNSWYAYKHLDLTKHTSNHLNSPYYLDVVVSESDSSILSVSVGPSNQAGLYPNALLNGLEIIKISNSKDSLDISDSNIHSLKSTSKANTVLILGIVVGVLFVFVGLAVVLFLVLTRRKGAHLDVFGNKVSGNVTSEYGNIFSLAAVRDATDNFSESLVIGVGGFGKVYKGVLKDDTKVAVKRGNPDSQQGLNEFRTEIEMLSHFRHRHLLALIGYCDEQNEMILVYEYMENGTLKSHLYGSNNPNLSWEKRLEICVGSARGLHYLHTGSAKPIIHRDVKTANILLHENLMAKVADFGLSKAGPDIDKTHVTTAVKGSFGYLDPEYLIRQQLTEKSDVYSFGVVLYEVLCGRPVIDPSQPRDKVNLVEWAMKLQKKGELGKIIDPNLEGQIKPKSLRKFTETAEKCLAECGLDRPTMGDVLWNLECALQLEEDEGLLVSFEDVSMPVDDTRPLQTLPSGSQYSVGSAEDIVNSSMSRVFSQMRVQELG